MYFWQKMMCRGVSQTCTPGRFTARYSVLSALRASGLCLVPVLIAWCWEHWAYPKTANQVAVEL